MAYYSSTNAEGKTTTLGDDFPKTIFTLPNGQEYEFHGFEQYELSIEHGHDSDFITKIKTMYWSLDSATSNYARDIIKAQGKLIKTY